MMLRNTCSEELRRTKMVEKREGTTAS